MGYIDWSGAEELVSLLVEYVATERNNAEGDPARAGFLAKLQDGLSEIEHRIEVHGPTRAIAMLRALRDRLDEGFNDDSVVEHVDACIDELADLMEDEG